MKIKFIGKHSFYRTEGENRRLIATVPDGTICEAKYCTKNRGTEINKGHLDVFFDDPTDGKRKKLFYCLHAHGDKCELIEED